MNIVSSTSRITPGAVSSLNFVYERSTSRAIPAGTQCVPSHESGHTS